MVSSVAVHNGDHDREAAKPKRVKRGRFWIVSDLDFTSEQLEQIASIPHRLRPKGSDASATNLSSHVPLGGRTVVYPFALAGIGSVMVKPYHRGGLVRWLIANRYLAWGESRAEAERKMLILARSFGVNAPEPVASITEEGVFYRCWLLTKEIVSHETLAQLSLRDPDAALVAMHGLMPQLNKLIQHNLLHFDFHPGNVLVQGDSSVWIVDFDKAKHFSGGENNLRELYSRRWRRAVIKHQLPDVLSEFFCSQQLRSSSIAANKV